MADDQYDALRQKAVDMQYKFRDFSSGYTHPGVHALQNEVNELVEDIEKRKNPRSIENRIKTIQHQLVQSEHAGTPIMHYEHKDFLHDNYEHMRQQMRHFDNY